MTSKMSRTNANCWNYLTKVIHKMILVFLLTCCVMIGTQGDSELCNYTTVLEWKSLDFDLPQNIKKKEVLIPENNIIGVSRYYRGRLFITVPRYRNGVPSSLNTVAIPSQKKSPKLQPFPSWSLNQVGDCTNYQNVAAIEIDPLGRLWIADNGIVSPYTNAIRTCRPKLVIYDLIGNKEIKRHYFEKKDVDRSFKQVVVDLSQYKTKGESMAYISDGGAQEIIVYSFKGNTSWSLVSGDMSRINNPTGLTVDDSAYFAPLGVCGMTLLDGEKNSDGKLIFSRIAPELFSLSRDALDKKSFSADSVKKLPAKPGSSESLNSDKEGVMYLATLGTSKLYSWNQTQPRDSQWKEECRLPNATFPWLDSPNFDENGDLWMVSNRYHEFSWYALTVGEKNVFSVINIPLNRTNYMTRHVDYASTASYIGCHHLIVFILTAIVSFTSSST